MNSWLWASAFRRQASWTTWRRSWASSVWKSRQLPWALLHRPQMLSLHSNQSSCVRGAKTMNDHTQCPACRSLSTHVTKGEFKASGFQAFGNRVCDECGTAWRPRCPRWAAILSIVTGCVMLGGIFAVPGGFFLSQSPSRNLNDANAFKGLFVLGFFVVMGFCSFFYGIAVLLG